jgi:hypothetical protein
MMGWRILLVLDEATNANLIGEAGHEIRALAECQKMGLDIHILVQSPNFPNPTDVFTNCRRHEWYYAASAAVERKGLEDLGEPELFPPLRKLRVRQRWVKQDSDVFFDEAPLLESPWIFPELTNRKVRKAIEEIRQRPEYGESTCSTGSSEGNSSSPSQPSTLVQPGTSLDSSPARRLRIARSKNSTTTDS